MAKKLNPQSGAAVPSQTVASGGPTDASLAGTVREYDLIGDVVFEPPLTPEERRRRGVGVSVEERLEQIRRRHAGESDRN